MSFEFDFDGNSTHSPARIRVIGVGGGGGNAVQSMMRSGALNRVEFVVANSDVQDLERNDAPYKIQLGPDLLKGLGCGADPAKGREAAMESQGEIAAAIEGADMVFVTAGMGGGTGTGAAPVVASVARDLGCLTVGVVTKPFWFEGGGRRKKSEEGILALREAVDSLILIPNDKLLQLTDTNTALKEAFGTVDQVLLDAVGGISEIIDVGGIINVDFMDVKSIMSRQGRALMGTGRASGDRRAETAAMLAISSPLLDDIKIDGATGILVNVTGGENLALHEIQAACAPIHDLVSGDNIIFGAVVDPSLGEEIKVTVIATGIDMPSVRPDRKTRYAGASEERGRERAPFTAPNEEQWDRPAFQRRREQERRPQQQSIPALETREPCAEPATVPAPQVTGQWRFDR